MNAEHRGEEMKWKTVSKDVKLFRNQQHLEHQTKPSKNDR